MPRESERIDFTVSKESATLRVWLDGVQYGQPGPEPRVALQLIKYLKENSGMNAEEHRRKQVGRMFVEVEAMAVTNCS